MKVFLSWSGNRSRAIAEALKGWLPSVLQATRPYFSPDDVTKGSRWLAEISKELEQCRIAILIITPENQEAPWLLFEAGALSKNFDSSRVCPLLFDGMEPTDVKGPLVQFQGAQFCKTEMKKVLKAVNQELGEAALSPEVLENVFEMWWPKLEKQVSSLLSELDEGDGVSKRSDRDLLEEVLTLTRRNNAIGRPRGAEVVPAAVEDLLDACSELATIASVFGPADDFLHAITHLYKPLQHIVGRVRLASTPERRRSLDRALDAIKEHLEPDLEATGGSEGEILDHPIGGEGEIA
jgi:hypothetical protein